MKVFALRADCDGQSHTDLQSHTLYAFEQFGANCSAQLSVENLHSKKPNTCQNVLSSFIFLYTLTAICLYCDFFVMQYQLNYALTSFMEDIIQTPM